MSPPLVKPSEPTRSPMGRSPSEPGFISTPINLPDSTTDFSLSLQEDSLNIHPMSFHGNWHVTSSAFAGMYLLSASQKQILLPGNSDTGERGKPDAAPCPMHLQLPLKCKDPARNPVPRMAHEMSADLSIRRDYMKGLLSFAPWRGASVTGGNSTLPVLHDVTRHCSVLGWDTPAHCPLHGSEQSLQTLQSVYFVGGVSAMLFRREWKALALKPRYFGYAVEPAQWKPRSGSYWKSSLPSPMCHFGLCDQPATRNKPHH